MLRVDVVESQGQAQHVPDQPKHAGGEGEQLARPLEGEDEAEAEAEDEEEGQGQAVHKHPVGQLESGAGREGHGERSKELGQGDRQETWGVYCHLHPQSSTGPDLAVTNYCFSSSDEFFE